MDYSLERLLRTSSSEKYALFLGRQAYADINIHYGERVEVDIILLNTAAEEVDEELINELDNILYSCVIHSYSSKTEEVRYNIYVGGGVVTTSTRPNEVPSGMEIEYFEN